VTSVVQPTTVGTNSLAAYVYADEPDPNRADNRTSETTTVVK